MWKRMCFGLGIVVSSSTLASAQSSYGTDGSRQLRAMPDGGGSIQRDCERRVAAQVRDAKQRYCDRRIGDAQTRCIEQLRQEANDKFAECAN